MSNGGASIFADDAQAIADVVVDADDVVTTVIIRTYVEFLGH